MKIVIIFLSMFFLVTFPVKADQIPILYGKVISSSKVTRGTGEDRHGSMNAPVGPMGEFQQAAVVLPKGLPGKVRGQVAAGISVFVGFRTQAGGAVEYAKKIVLHNKDIFVEQPGAVLQQ